jgi:cytosine/adenosine deaminase-related metal-dependent hydrolase
MNRLVKLNNIKWVCHHLHIDKSKTIHPTLLNESLAHMKEKWFLMRNIKEQYTTKSLYNRMYDTTAILVEQGCFQMRTFIDVDTIVGLDALYCARDIKEFWKTQGVDLQIGTQLLEGLETRESIQLFNTAAPLVDFIGCLPSRDVNPGNHLDIVFSKATELNKNVEAHLDQCNIPTEKETEMFCNYVEKYNYQGKSRAIHCVSLACQPLDYQKKIARRMSNLDIGVIICPSAAISMTQHTEYNVPVHNSIGPVKIFLEEGVNVGLGVDNVEDIFMPFCDGDLMFELRLLAEAERIYQPDTLVNIATNNMGFT